MMQLTPEQHQQFQLGLLAVQQGLISSECLLSGLQKWLGGSQDSLSDIILSHVDVAEHSRETLRRMLLSNTGKAGSSKPDPLLAATADDNYRVQDHHIDIVQQLLQPGSQPTIDHIPPTAIYAQASNQSQSHQSHSNQSQGSHDQHAQARQAESGRFRIGPKLAAGGLGVVYRGTDLQLNRAVAIKKIKALKSDEPIIREKLLLEAEVTGQLEHPGIVPVYALVTDARHESYYAMRLIRGQDLAAEIRNFHKQHADRPGAFDTVAFRGLLRRFIDVCNAIGYAHWRGVIHRDLKPANIMLGPHGETLVVDWGLAKIVHSQAKDSSTINSSVLDEHRNDSQVETELPEQLEPVKVSGLTDWTIMGTFAGTPRYAAPEQLAGKIDRLDARTDVYSLGAVLYELLCGRPPLPAEIRSASETLRALKAGMLESPRVLLASVPKPLEAICVKAMQLDADERYASAKLLAQDVERWLADARVLAYQNEPASERISRWLRHHRSWTLAIASALVVIALVASVASYLINQAWTSEQVARLSAQEFKGDAVARYRVARQAVDTLVERSERLLDVPGSSNIRLAMLDEAVERYAALSQSESQDPELEIERVRAIVRLGDVRHLQGKYSEGNSDYQRAIELLSRALGTTQDRPSLSASTVQLTRAIELGRTYSRIGLAASTTGQLIDARRYLEQSLRIFEAWSPVDRQPRSNNRGFFTGGLLAGNWAIALTQLASIEMDEGRAERAVVLLEKAVPLLTEALSQSPSVPDQESPTGALAAPVVTNYSSQHELFALADVAAHEALGRAYRKSGQHARASGQFQLAVAGCDRLLDRQPDNPRYRERSLSLMVSIAQSHRGWGDWQAAVMMLEQARTGYGQLCSQFPDSVGYEHQLLQVTTDLALVQLELDDLRPAQDNLTNALSAAIQLRERFPTLQGLVLTQAVTINAMGQVLARQTPPAPESLDYLRGALESLTLLVEEELDAERDRETWAYELFQARHRAHYARQLAVIGQMEEARAEFARAQSIFEACIKRQVNSWQARSDLAHAHWYAGLAEFDTRPTVARSHFQAAESGWAELLEQDYTPLHAYYLARLYTQCPDSDLRKPDQARSLSDACCQAVPDNAAFQSLSRLVKSN